jgi:hypothetical protein
MKQKKYQPQIISTPMHCKTLTNCMNVPNNNISTQILNHPIPLYLANLRDLGPVPTVAPLLVAEALHQHLGRPRLLHRSLANLPLVSRHSPNPPILLLLHQCLANLPKLRQFLVNRNRLQHLDSHHNLIPH